MTARWSQERHTVRATRSVSHGWSVPVTACGLVVRSGSELSDSDGPTCVRCVDIAAGRTRQGTLVGVA